MAQQTWWQTLSYINASQTAVTATSATDLSQAGDYTFPTNYFYVGWKGRIKASGVISSTSGSNTITFTVQLGATTINAAFGSISLVASQTNIKWDLELTVDCRAVGTGTSTTFVVEGRIIMGSAILAVTTQMLPASGAAGVGTGVDYTATQKCALMAAFNNASNSITLEHFELASLN